MYYSMIDWEKRKFPLRFFNKIFIVLALVFVLAFIYVVFTKGFKVILPNGILF